MTGVKPAGSASRSKRLVVETVLRGQGSENRIAPGCKRRHGASSQRISCCASCGNSHSRKQAQESSSKRNHAQARATTGKQAQPRASKRNYAQARATTRKQAQPRASRRNHAHAGATTGKQAQPRTSRRNHAQACESKRRAPAREHPRRQIPASMAVSSQRLRGCASGCGANSSNRAQTGDARTHASSVRPSSTRMQASSVRPSSTRMHASYVRPSSTRMHASSVRPSSTRMHASSVRPSSTRLHASSVRPASTCMPGRDCVRMPCEVMRRQSSACFATPHAASWRCAAWRSKTAPRRACLQAPGCVQPPRAQARLASPGGLRHQARR